MARNDGRGRRAQPSDIERKSRREVPSDRETDLGPLHRDRLTKDMGDSGRHPTTGPREAPDTGAKGPPGKGAGERRREED